MRMLVLARQRFMQEMLIETLSACGTIVAADASGPDPVAFAAEARPPCLVIVDTAHPDRFEQVRAIRLRFPAIKVAVLAVAHGDEEFLAWANIGIAAYVEPTTTIEQLTCTVRRVAAGEVVCPTRLTALLLKRFSITVQSRAATGGIHHLTPRELEVLELVADGLGNKLIARQLRIAGATVKNHVHSILEKLNVRSRGEAAACHRRSKSQDVDPFQKAA